MKIHRSFRYTLGCMLSIRERMKMGNLHGCPGNMYDDNATGIRKMMIFDKYVDLGNTARKLYWDLHKSEKFN